MRRGSHLAKLVVCYALLSPYVPAFADQTAVGTSSRPETPDAVLTGEAWELADAAFAAYNKKDFTTAATLARKAQTLSPRAPQLYALEIFALQQSGRHEDAVNVARDAISKGLQRGVFTSTITAASKTVQNDTAQTPPAAARISAKQAAYMKGHRLATAAYSAFSKENYARAAALAKQAFMLAPDQTNWALLWVDALQSQGSTPQAINSTIDEALAVSVGGREELLKRRIDIEALRREQERRKREEEANAYAQRAYSAYAQAQYAQAIENARQAVALTPNNRDLQKLLTTTLAAGNEVEKGEALERLNAELTAHPANAELLTGRAYLYQNLGRMSLAYLDFEAARATGDAAPITTLDHAYSAAAMGKKRQAASLLREGLDRADTGEINLTDQQRMNLRQNVANLEREWGAYASAGYRGARPATSGLGGSPSAALGDAVFSTVEAYWRPSQILNSSSRIFEVYGRVSNTLHDKGASVAESFDACGNRYPADSYRSVAGWPSTVGSLGLRFTPSTTFGLTLGLERRFTLGTRSRLGSSTPQDCTLGIPGKEYQTASHDGDWLAYLTYAYYKGTELRTDQSSWWRIEGYAQAGYLWSDTSAQFRDSGKQVFDQNGRVTRDHQFLSSELRIGKSMIAPRLGSRLILYPHVVIAADWQKENRRAHIDGVGSLSLQGNDKSWSMGTGPGIGVRYWFRSDHYSAEKSYLDWTVQYRFNVGGGERDRSKGLFMNLTVSW